MNRDVFLRIYHYCIEIVLLYIFVFIYGIHSDVIPAILPFLAIVVGGMVIMLTLFYVTKSRSFFVILAAAILIAGVGFLVDYQLELLIILALFVMWRVPAHLNQPNMEHEMKVLGLTFILGIVMYFIAKLLYYTHAHVILILTSSQVILVMAGKFIDSMLANRSNRKESKELQTKWILIVFSSITAVVLICTFALPILNISFVSLVKGILFGLAYILTPLIYILLGLQKLVQNLFGDESEPLPDIEQENPTKPNESEGFVFTDGDSPFWWILLVIVLLTVLYLYWKKYNVKTREIRSNVELVSSFGIVSDNKRGYLKKSKPPKDYVRKQFFDLERFAAKHNVGRKRDETANEWLKRIGYEENIDMISYYETVRYYEVPLSNVEKEAYDKIIRDIKQKIKQNKK